MANNKKYTILYGRLSQEDDQESNSIQNQRLILTRYAEETIVKDMNRLGRDYLQTGFLMRHTFPNNNVRFIAINDAVDTLYGDNGFAPFRNLFNNFYAKDRSKKIHLVKKTQAERGERVGTRPPYGYKKDEIFCPVHNCGSCTASLSGPTGSNLKRRLA